jgi:antitoxin Phd
MTPSEISEGRILIVDDEPSVRDSYAHILTEDGFKVSSAADTFEALRRIRTSQFDLVFTDASTPGMGGLALVRQIRAFSQELKIVLMIDSLDNETAIEAAELGALQLIKPINRESLKKTAAHALRFRHLWQKQLSSFRFRRSERLELMKVTATHAKNEFGSVLDLAIQGEAVFITKHKDPKAVLISVGEYYALSRAKEAKLETLTEEFDALLAQMQTADARRGMKAAFNATPEQLGQAAVAAARKRG